MRIEFSNWSKLWHPPLNPSMRHWYKVGTATARGRKKDEKRSFDVVKGVDSAFPERKGPHRWDLTVMLPSGRWIDCKGSSEVEVENKARIAIEQAIKKEGWSEAEAKRRRQRELDEFFKKEGWE